MADRVLIVVGVGLVLDLPREVFNAHLVPVYADAPQQAASTPPSVPQLMTAKTLGRFLSLPTSTVYELARSKKIPSVRVGKTVRFDPTAVRAALSNGGGN